MTFDTSKITGTLFTRVTEDTPEDEVFQFNANGDSLVGLYSPDGGKTFHPIAVTDISRTHMGCWFHIHNDVHGVNNTTVQWIEAYNTLIIGEMNYLPASKELAATFNLSNITQQRVRRNRPRYSRR